MEAWELSGIVRVVSSVIRDCVSRVETKLRSEFEQRFRSLPTPERGLSAYEIASANGFAGTQQEWLASLRGQDAPVVDTEKLAFDVACKVEVPPIPPEEFAEKIWAAVQRVLAEREFREAWIAALPKPQDGKDGRDAPPVDVDSIIAEVTKRIPVPKDGERGLPGENAAPVDVDAIVLQVASLIPTPKDGRDGKDIDAEQVRSLIQAEVAKAVAAIPPAKDGKDADTDAIVREVTARIPIPKDGKDADVEELQRLIETGIARAVAAIPTPKDGAPGRDADPIHPDTLRLLVLNEVTRAVSELPKPKDGEDGAPGRDAIQLDIIPAIDPTRSYPPGTYAKYCGGLVRSLRWTKPGDFDPADWDIVVRGYPRVQFIQDETDPRIIRCEAAYAGEEKDVVTFRFPVPFHRGVFRDENEYERAETVTHGGSTWFCLADKTRNRPQENGTNGGSKDWQLMVKEGRKGRDSESVDAIKGEVAQLNQRIFELEKRLSKKANF